MQHSHLSLASSLQSFNLGGFIGALSSYIYTPLPHNHRHLARLETSQCVVLVPCIPTIHKTLWAEKASIGMNLKIDIYKCHRNTSVTLNP